MKSNTKNVYPFMNWIIEVAEEKIIEHRLLKKIFNSHEEFIIFTIVWLRVYKALVQKIKKENLQISKNTSEKKIDEYIKNFYINQNNAYLGMTINAISRESLIPRSTVKRMVENLIEKKMIKRNFNRLIIPTSIVRDEMKFYRKYIFQSNKKITEMFNDYDLMTQYKEENIF